MPRARRQPDALARECPVGLQRVLARAAVDRVTPGPDKCIERAHEPVVAGAEQDGLLADAGATAAHPVVAGTALERDRAGHRSEDVVVPVIPAEDRGRVADAGRPDGADRADAVVPGASADGDGGIA